MATEAMTIMLKNLASGERHWFSDAAIERAVACNGGPEGATCVAVMPEDWPDDAGEFDDGSNIWLLHDADETY